MTPWLDDGDVRLYHGDALEVLRGLPDGSVDCCVTSPPYWGLRDYGIDGQLGLEATPDEYVAGMVAVFREVRRVLADNGTCWVNLGDSYAGSWGAQSRELSDGDDQGANGSRRNPSLSTNQIAAAPRKQSRTGAIPEGSGLKPKDLVGIPWRVAFALQADGWYLRSDVVWAKPNPMPESVTDRPTKSHEYVFLLTKRPRYWFDAEAVREPNDTTAKRPNYTAIVDNRTSEKYGAGMESRRERHGDNGYINPAGRNVRSVWQIATQPYPEAHFATFPEELARRCILAGCPVRVCRVCGKPSERIVERTGERETHGVNHVADDARGRHGVSSVFRTGVVPINETVGWSDCGCLLSKGVTEPTATHGGSSPFESKYRPGVVLDPFMGSGTVAKVARDHQRHAIGIDLNEQYLQLAARRLQQLSLLNEGAA